MVDRWARTVRCQDFAGRLRHLLVIVTDRGIGLVAPAGESAFVGIEDIAAVKQALTEAHLEAMHRGVTAP